MFKSMTFFLVALLIFPSASAFALVGRSSIHSEFNDSYFEQDVNLETLSSVDPEPRILHNDDDNAAVGRPVHVPCGAMSIKQCEKSTRCFVHKVEGTNDYYCSDRFQE